MAHFFRKGAANTTALLAILKVGQIYDFSVLQFSPPIKQPADRNFLEKARNEIPEVFSLNQRFRYARSFAFRSGSTRLRY